MQWRFSRSCLWAVHLSCSNFVSSSANQAVWFPFSPVLCFFNELSIVSQRSSHPPLLFVFVFFCGVSRYTGITHFSFYKFFPETYTHQKFSTINAPPRDAFVKSTIALGPLALFMQLCFTTERRSRGLCTLADIASWNTRCSLFLRPRSLQNLLLSNLSNHPKYGTSTWHSNPRLDRSSQKPAGTTKKQGMFRFILSQ